MVKMNAMDVQVLQVSTRAYPISAHRVLFYRWLSSWEGHLCLTNALAENAYDVLCKYAHISSAATHAIICSAAASIRSTPTPLPVSDTYSTDARTSSL